MLEGIPKKAKGGFLIDDLNSFSNWFAQIREQVSQSHQFGNLPKLKAALHRLPEVDADLSEVNFEANSQAISSEIRIIYYKKYIENKPPDVVAAESAETEIEPEENVVLKLNQAYIEKHIFREEGARNQLLVGDRVSKNQPIRAKHCQTSIRHNHSLLR